MDTPARLDVAVRRRGCGMLDNWNRRVGHLKRETYALYLAYRDPRTPWYAKAFSALVVGYAFSPIDLIPDPIPVLGYLDDLILIPLGIALAVKMIPPVVLEESREQARSVMEQGKPSGKAAAVVILTIWLLLAAAVAIAVYGLVWR